MPQPRQLPTHEADLLALEGITSTPAGLIDGYVIILSVTGGDSRVITNACCVQHALRFTCHLASEHLGEVPPCQGETS